MRKSTLPLFLVISAFSLTAYLWSQPAAGPTQKESGPGKPLAPAEAVKQFKIAPGLRIELVAAEPLVQSPVAIAFDAEEIAAVVALVREVGGAVLGASWPFLLVLVAIFIANEVFKKYHSRLVFTATLFFFALFSYTIVTTPILTRSIGTFTFLLSGIVALALFALFLKLLARLGPQQWRGARWWIALGAAAVYATLNLFYFTGVLPPLPLALADGGVYHFVAKSGDSYRAQDELQPWYARFGVEPVMHMAPGEALYLYSAVFAPIRLSTDIVHRWQRYDAARGKWLTVSKVIFPINGGRDGGYRGYSITHKVAPGDWRVDIDTVDGHIIGRVRFSVEMVAQKLTAEQKLLR